MSETGHDLLEQILAEQKAQWNGKGRYKEPRPPKLEEVPAIPKNWVYASFDQITKNFDGTRVPLKKADRDRRSGKFPYYGASGVIDDIDDYLFDGEFLLVSEDGANLLARSTPIAFQARGKFWVNNHAHIVQAKGGVPLGYIEHYFNGKDISRFVTGTAQPKLNQANLNQIPIPLPPLPEQRRIVARIEELFSRLNAGVAGLHHAKAQLQRYRQSVLAAAVTGQLTQAWREQHPDTAPTEEHEGSANLFGQPLPDTWACRPLGDVVSEGPRNGFSPKCAADASGSRVLKLSATTSGRMLLNEKTTKVSIEPVAADSHAWLRPNDVLIQRANSLELLGSTAIYADNADQFVYPDLMMRVRVPQETIRNLLVLYLNSLPARNYFQRNATGVAGNMPKINGATVKALPVPVPPLAEQRQIVAEVQARTSAIDLLEAELERQIDRSNRLRQSTLNAAFSGAF